MPVKSTKSDIKNIPKLRFLGFSDAWEEKRFGEIFSFKTTNSFSRVNLNYKSGEVKNIHYGDIHTKFKTRFDITKEKVPFVNSAIKLNKTVLDNYCKEGDLIIADASEDYSDIGKCIEIINLNNEKVLAGLHTLQASPNLNLIYTGFGGYLMKSRNVHLQIMKIAQGTKVLSISAGRLSNISLKLPSSILEQQKISNFLESIDEWINNLKSQRENFESYKKGMMIEIITGKYRFPGFNDKWKYVKLESFAMDKKYSIVDGPFGSQMKVQEFTTEGIPVIEMDQLDNKQSIKSAIRYISKEKFQSVKRSAVYPGDILISKTGTIGLLGIATVEVNPGIITSRLAKISINKNIADTAFIFHCLVYLKQDGYWTQVSQGGTMQVLGTKMIKDAPIPGISKLEQEKIGEFLTYLDKVIELKNNQIIQAEQWKKGLMQGLFL